MAQQVKTSLLEIWPPECFKQYMEIPSNIVPSLVGSLVGGLCTLVGVMFSNSLDALKRRRADIAGVRRFKTAIAAELRAILALYESNIEAGFKSIKPGAPVLLRSMIQENYFVVFEANASRLGDIGDPILRARIIRTYVAARSFIDTVRQNNAMVENYKEYEARANAGGNAFDIARRDSYFHGLAEYSAIVLGSAKFMKQQLLDTIDALEDNVRSTSQDDSCDQVDSAEDTSNSPTVVG